MKRKRTRELSDLEPDLPRITLPMRRPFVSALWAALLVLVLAAIVIPFGQSTSPARTRRARKTMVTAQEMEKQGLWLAAADAYEQLTLNEQLKPEVRSQAAERLAWIYSHELQNEELAKKSLEKAFFFAADPERKGSLQRRLADFNLHAPPPQGNAVPIPPGTDSASAGDFDSSPATSKSGSPLIAKIGETVISLDDVFYAWKRLQADQQPTPKNLEAFTTEYMNNVLLAEAARRQGLAEEKNHALEINFYENQLLAQAVLRSAMPQVDDATIQNFYNQNPGLFTPPVSIALDHIIVDSAEAASAAADRLASGEPFADVARAVSLDAASLPNATSLGRIDAESNAIPFVGPAPKLAARLTEYDDGTTTGPIESARGFHFFRITEKMVPNPIPLEEVDDEIEMIVRREQLQSAQRQLLDRLKSEIPIEIYEASISDAVKKAAEDKEEEP